MIQPLFFSGPSPQFETLILATLLIIICCGVLVFQSKRAGLSNVPGPFLARFTDAWGLYFAWWADISGDKISLFRDLQKEYGDVIRTGPRSITVLDPAAVPVIYG